MAFPPLDRKGCRSLNKKIIEDCGVIKGLAHAFHSLSLLSFVLKYRRGFMLVTAGHQGLEADDGCEQDTGTVIGQMTILVTSMTGGLLEIA